MRALPSEPVLTSLATAELQMRDRGILLLLDGAESSWIDLHDPEHLDFEYLQQMDAALTALRGESEPVRAVHLGGAGCALARAWDAARPGSTQLAVEIDAVLAQRVREWFDLPRAPRLRIRVGDAARVVPSLRAGEWDVLVRDAFRGADVPAACRTHEFIAACRHALSPSGIYLANTTNTTNTADTTDTVKTAGAAGATDAPRRTFSGELAITRRVFGGVLVVADPAVARGRRRGNLVIVARDDPFTAREAESVERAVRRLPLPVRTWRADDPVWS